MRRQDWTYLFSEYDLCAVLQHQLKAINDKVIAIPKDRFKADSNEQIAAAVASELVIEPLEFDDDEITVDSRDVKVDVGQDFNRAISNRSQPYFVDGTEVSYHLPFRGEKQLLKCRGNQFTMNPPRAEIGRGELVYPYQVAGQDIASTKQKFDEDLRSLKQWLPWINGPVAAYNATLEDEVRQRVAQRRSELEKAAIELGALGFKVYSSGQQATRTAVPEPIESRRERHRVKAAKQYDVALSFAGEDREYVARVAESLKTLDVSVFYDDFEKVDLWGKDLTTHLADVYGRQSLFVVIFASKHYAAKAWPNHERAVALGRQFVGDRDRVLPVRFDSTEIPGMPSSVSYLDLRVLNPEKLAELIRQKLDAEEK
jgi:hypothetical protein